MMSFQWPWMFLLLPLPWLVWRYFPPLRRTAGAALYVPFFDAVAADRQHTSALPVEHSRSVLIAKYVIWVLLLLAAARPQWLGDTIELPITGRDLLIAIDISGSMEKEKDISLDGVMVSRLEAAKSITRDFLYRRRGDRIGLVLYGQRPYLQTPLTFDLKTVSHMLEEAEAGLAGGRTAIGDAIGLSLKRLRQMGSKQKVLILMTDGVNNAGKLAPRKAASLAREEGMRIYTLGIGADRVDYGMFGIARRGPVYLDEQLLRDIAVATGGIYFRARDDASMRDFYRQVQDLEPMGTGTEYLRPVTALFYWPLGLALLLSANFLGYYLYRGRSRLVTT